MSSNLDLSLHDYGTFDRWWQSTNSNRRITTKVMSPSYGYLTTSNKILLTLKCTIAIIDFFHNTSFKSRVSHWAPQSIVLAGRVICFKFHYQTVHIERGSTTIHQIIMHF